jgi:hypothetical protein
MGTDGARPRQVRSRHGGAVTFRDGRRVEEHDRDGRHVATCRWDGRGRLEWAAVRTAWGDWIGIEPGAAVHPEWGASDRLRLLAGPAGVGSSRPLTLCEAMPWHAITHIPPLAEPASLPPGAGTAVLNLLAALAQDQGLDRIRYSGPYPTEQLFTALLESFRYDAADDPLGRFLAGDLAWAPAPHERRFPAHGVCVQLRDGVEKVVAGGRAYYRDAWQSVRRHAPRRVRASDDTVRCSLVALEVVVEDHLVLTPTGDIRAVVAPVTDVRPARPVDPAVRAGLRALLRATSAPALARAIDRVVDGIDLEWGGVTADLVEARGSRVRFGQRLADVGAARIAAASSPAERLGRALELLSEMARLLGDVVRSRAQAVLLDASRPVQHAALAAEHSGDPAPAIAGACAALAGPG